LPKNPYDLRDVASVLVGGPEKKKPIRDSRRAFNQTQRNRILFQQNSKCAKCHKKLDPRAMHFHHKKPWSSGGRTITENGRALCPTCHAIVTSEERLKKVDKKRRTKKPSNIFDIPRIKLP
jgi:5-methylcytosine-specific restriction endonuclease McrA